MSEVLVRLRGGNGWVVKCDRARRSSDLRSRNDTDPLRILEELHLVSVSEWISETRCPHLACFFKHLVAVTLARSSDPSASFAGCYLTWKIVVFEGSTRQDLFYRSSSLPPPSSAKTDSRADAMERIKLI